jgi:hypothetical protein
MSDEELERKFAARLEKQRTQNDNLLKQILLDKQSQFNDLINENQFLKEKLKEYNSNYINKLEHESALKVLKDEINDIVNKYSEMERGKKFERNEKNLLFVKKKFNISRTIKA